MIRVDVPAAETQERIVQSKGREFKFYEQIAWAFLVAPGGKLDEHPTKITISHDKPEQAYPKGTYTIAPESLIAGNYGRLDVRVKLRQAQAAVKTA